MSRIGEYIFGFLLYLLFRLDSLLYSLPAWLTLILHFTNGLSIKWFWLVFGLWFAVGIIRYLILMFARWGGNSESPKQENKNPYSHKNS